jgi:hypothetical protein
MLDRGPGERMGAVGLAAASGCGEARPLDPQTSAIRLRVVAWVAREHAMVR